MTEETFHGKLVAKRDGIYTVYVFQSDTGEYKMCTKLPNWGEYNIRKEDSGFVTMQNVVAGESYFDRETQQDKIFQYTNIYFKDFIKDNENAEQIIL